MDETYSKWPEWQKVYVYMKILTPRGCLPPAPGPCTCIKTWKIMFIIRLPRYFLKLATNGQSDKAFLLPSEFCPHWVVCPCPGAIYMWKNIKKMCIKSEFNKICLKLATNGRSGKGFLLTSKVCPQGVFCPCPGAIYMSKIIKNVYKIMFLRDHFETCNIWAKRKGLSVIINVSSPMGCLPLPGAIYVWKKKG